jgi:GNAT superfamily N-acetyltransferase
VWVLDEGAVIAAIIVLLPAPNYLLLDNIAACPTRQGLGLGSRLLAFAEDEALRGGYREIRLCTHEAMVENQRLYASIGYEERDAAARPATTASSCASAFAIKEFTTNLSR